MAVTQSTYRRTFRIVGDTAGAVVHAFYSDGELSAVEWSSYPVLGWMIYLHRGPREWQPHEPYYILPIISEAGVLNGDWCLEERVGGRTFFRFIDDCEVDSIEAAAEHALARMRRDAEQIRKRAVTGDRPAGCAVDPSAVPATDHPARCR